MTERMQADINGETFTCLSAVRLTGVFSLTKASEEKKIKLFKREINLWLKKRGEGRIYLQVNAAERQSKESGELTSGRQQACISQAKKGVSTWKGS